MAAAKSGHSYRCSGIVPAENEEVGSLVAAQIDLDKCTFSITLKKASLDVTLGTVEFGMSFTGFDEAVDVSV